MQTVILAGGLGTRISEETAVRPKPMVEVGGKPILWHIMKGYSAHGVHDFIVCCGYKGYMIKEYFANYFLHTSDVTFDMQRNSMEVHQKHAEPWRVTLVDTGEHTMTGGRLARVRNFVGDADFCMTYGDGVSDVDIEELIRDQCEECFLPSAHFLGLIPVTNHPIIIFGRYCSASAKWIGWISSLLARSAIVRANFKIR